MKVEDDVRGIPRMSRSQFWWCSLRITFTLIVLFFAFIGVFQVFNLNRDWEEIVGLVLTIYPAQYFYSKLKELYRGRLRDLNINIGDGWIGGSWWLDRALLVFTAIILIPCFP